MTLKMFIKEVRQSIQRNQAYTDDEIDEILEEFQETLRTWVLLKRETGFVAGMLVAQWNLQGRMRRGT